MLNRILLIIATVVVAACYPIDSSNTFNKDFSFAETTSKPIYLGFRDTKKMPFYFMLAKDSNKSSYRVIVRWKNPRKNELLFDGVNTTLKFMVDKVNIYTFNPVKRTKVVAYNINDEGQEEEGVFAIPDEIFQKIAFSKDVTVELRGKEKAVIGEFNRLNTLKAFRDFYENSL